MTAKARYGLVAESIERTSTRAELGLPKAGTRTRAERLRWPQLTKTYDSVIALGSWSGKTPLYELALGMVTAVYSRACTGWPAMKARAVCETIIVLAPSEAAL